MLVVDPDAPAVPKLRVFVLPDAVAFAKKFAVNEPVGVPPNVYEVVAPNCAPVRILVLNNEPVPVLVDVMLGEAPFIANEVALAAVNVTLRKFKVPVVAPIVTVVAAPKMFPVKAAALKTEAVPVLLVVILGDAPFIAKLVALAAVNVTFLRLSVPVVAPIVKVVAAPNKFPIVAVVL